MRRRSCAPRELVLFCGRLNSRWDEARPCARLERFLVPLRTPFRSLSKGQKGAVMLALALGHDPELLLLDDPTLGLDVVARRARLRRADRRARRPRHHRAPHDARPRRRRGHRRPRRDPARQSPVLDGELEALKAEHGASLEEIFAAVAGERASDARRARRRGRPGMRALLAITARELRERWALPFATFVCGLRAALIGPLSGRTARPMAGMPAVATAWARGAADWAAR